MIIMRRGWACWRKQLRQGEDEQASDNGDAPDAQDGSHGANLTHRTNWTHCPLCDMELNGPTQDYDHRWHKDVFTGVTAPSKLHHINLKHALEAAEVCSGPEVNFVARKKAR